MRRSKRPRSGSLRRGDAPSGSRDDTAGPSAPVTNATTRQADLGGAGAPPAPNPLSGATSGAGECPAPPSQDLRVMVQEIVREAIGQLVTEGRPGMCETNAAVGPGERWEGDAGTRRDFMNVSSPPPVIEGDPQASTGGHISASMRQRIIGHRYIDLRTLLLSSEYPSGDDQQFLVAQNGRITFCPASRRELSESQWAKAFLRYASVYVEEYPGEAAAIITYMSTVMNLCSQGLGKAWKEYDESFRRARENSPAAYPWDRPPQMIWMGAVATGLASLRSGLPTPRVSRLLPPQQPSALISRRFPKCRDFNSYSGCTWPNCRYRHACERCEGPHGKPQCPDPTLDRRGALSNGVNAPPQQ